MGGKIFLSFFSNFERIIQLQLQTVGRIQKNRKHLEFVGNHLFYINLSEMHGFKKKKSYERVLKCSWINWFFHVITLLLAAAKMPVIPSSGLFFFPTCLPCLSVLHTFMHAFSFSPRDTLAFSFLTLN